MPPADAHDRFDHLPHRVDRVGAHRAPGRRGRGWVAFWWALGATLALIAAGVFGILSLNNQLDITIPGISPSASGAPASDAPASDAPASDAPAAAPTPEATVAPDLGVTVLNGSTSNGVAASAARTLTEAGWTVGTTANADSQDQPTTIVYFADPGIEGAALGVAQSLPGAQILLSNDFSDSGTQLTVVIGNNYVFPAQ